MKQRMLIVLCTYLVSFCSLPEIKLNASSNGAGGTPVTVSAAFIEGAAPGNLQTRIDGTNVPSQIDIKTRWKDGSIKHALVTFVPPVTAAGSIRTLSFNNGVNTDTVPITISSILTTDFDAKASFTMRDSVFTVSARDLLSAGKFTYWMKGSLTTEFILRGKPKTADGITTEDVFVQMCIRFDNTLSNARISYEIENSKKQHIQDVIYGVTLSIGNISSQEVFRQDSVKQFYMTRWRKIYYWGTTPNEFSIKYPLSYLISTGLVPRFDTTITIAESKLASRAAAWSTISKGIMGNGFIQSNFGTTGARDEIGPQPRWTAEYLLSMDDRARQVCMGHGDLSGSFSVHLRESDSVRTVGIWQYPTVTIMTAAAQWSDPKDKIPTATGPCTTPYNPDGAHQPDFAYIPYLLSGDYYYLEEMYYWCSWNLLKYNPGYRQQGKGLLSVEYDEVRGLAWVIRTMGEAAAIAPDGDFEKVYYDSIVRYNLSYHTERLLGSTPDNELGVWIWKDGIGENRCGAGLATCISAFTCDFLAISLDHLYNLGFETAAPLRDFMLKGTAERFRGDNGFNPYCGTEYRMPTSKIVNIGGVDSYQPYKTWAEVYAGMGSRVCELAYITCGQCYSAVAMAALSAYSRTNVEKADTAYRFLSSRVPKSTFVDDVTFALVPGPSRSIVGIEKNILSTELAVNVELISYPNPANPSTQLVLKLNSPQKFITANVYSISGKLISRINMEKRGEVYKGVLNSQLLSSGNYIISIVNNKQLITRKFSLVK